MFNGISIFVGYLMSKLSLWNSSGTVLPIAELNSTTTVPTFLKGISAKVNVIVWLELEPAYYYVAV